MSKLKLFRIYLLAFFIISMHNVYSQQKFSTLISTSLEDEIVILSVDKHVYYPGDAIQLRIQRNNNSETVIITPILLIEGVELKSIGKSLFGAVIPKACTPGQYKVRLKVSDDQGRKFVYETDCVVDIEEYQLIEQISRYVHVEPVKGSENPQTAVTLDRDQIENLSVIFKRDSIGAGMGPQFVTIKTSVILRDGTTSQTLERRVLTFRSEKDINRDRDMLIQYRRAYGAYAAIKSEEFSRVRIHVDSLPDWAIIKINIEPDYTIKIGGYDKENSLTRYFRIRGPQIEIGFSLGIPKVLFDTQARDTISYGNYSAMIRFYYVDRLSGHRFPVNLGVGTFGVNSPVDVNVARGGFALSVFLDVAEMMRIIGLDFIKKISAGLEFVPFFVVERRARFLIVAQFALAL
jgi:hypothetical protein